MFRFSPEWQSLDNGAPAERAAFSELSIWSGDICLTEGRDALVNALRRGPYVSAYHLAEWLVWNWWRLRWESRSSADDWMLAHHLGSIGEGYVWPNVTIFSDGERVAVISKSTRPTPDSTFRYINELPLVMPARMFESAVDEFANTISDRLRSQHVEDTNFDVLWRELSDERRDPNLSRIRRLEALQGFDPGDALDADIENLVDQGNRYGAPAADELAAARASVATISTEEIESVARNSGMTARLPDQFVLSPGTGLPRASEVAAWRLGKLAARAVREQAGLANEPVADRQLAELAGIGGDILAERPANVRLAYSLDTNSREAKIVLRSRFPMGRRFELARLIGDKVVGARGDKLHPATKAYTYRQKMQRSFAAELLSPFDTVDEMLEGDYTEEAQEQVAQHFQVSPLVIRTLLTNHHRIERDELDDFDAEVRVA